MAVPPPGASCWLRLASGGLAQVRSSNFGTQMLTKRLQLSNASLNDKAREIHDYYAKWERGLSDEIAQFA